MKADAHIELPHKPADRVVMALVCPIMFLFVGLALVLISKEWRPNGILEHACKLVVEEVVLTFTIVFGLAIIWSLFAPQWVARLVDRFAGKAVIGSIALFAGGMAVLLGVEIVRSMK